MSVTIPLGFQQTRTSPKCARPCGTLRQIQAISDPPDEILMRFEPAFIRIPSAVDDLSIREILGDRRPNRQYSQGLNFGHSKGSDI